MKQILKNLLFKKRIKILKSTKGFSLLEVLIAVGIIAIISAIAVPQYTANKREAAKVAGDTSMSNILKAYNHCIALNDFTSCNTLALLKVTCPDCDSKNHAGDSRFCAEIEKKSGGDTFKACFHIQGTTVTRKYGGSLLGNVCKLMDTAVDRDPNTNGVQAAKITMTPVQICEQNTECGNNGGTKTFTCESSGEDGECDNNANCT